MQADIEQTYQGFERVFGGGPEAVVRSPGRVNLIGEHTDYNDGFVFPMAIERSTLLAARWREDRRVRMYSQVKGEEAMLDLDALTPQRGVWWSYLAGVLAGWRERGLPLRGMDLWIDTTIPLGGGLSSSASLEVGLATVLESLSGHAMDPVAKALLCQQSEHRFAGVPCGIMDQFIVAMARAGEALRIDCRDHTTQSVPMPPGAVVMVIDSGVKHELAGGEYAQRRAACEAASSELGVRALRDATLEQVQLLRDGLLRRRARHVVTENARTLEATHAFHTGDLDRFGRLMAQSHASLRDDYEVSCPELDAIVDIASGVSGVLGARMTGGGFGGCAIALVEPGSEAKLEAALRSGYREDVSTFVTRAAAGARRVT